MNQKPLKVLITAGGTGGHVFPALAVAAELQKLGVKVAWLGTRRGIEARLVPEAGIALHCLSVQGVRGRGWQGLLKAPFLMAAALGQSLLLLLKLRPQLVLGFGGFASGPGGLAAKVLWIPLMIHEQNAIPGTTNRYLAPLARRVLTAFPTSLRRAQVVGNPVRANLAALAAPEERFAHRRDKPLRLLVLGGSLGARAINELVPEALARMAPEERPQVWHQAGRDHEAAVAEHYQRLGVEAQVDAFIDDMAKAYGWADWAVCRAGALTVSELASVGLAALLIPFPYAIDDHQTHNAAVLVNAGAALAVSQRDLDAEKLEALIRTEFSDRPALRNMAQAGRQMATPQAARVVAEQCIEVARG